MTAYSLPSPAPRLYSLSSTLCACELELQRGHKQVLHSISMALHAGELVCLLGANGAGKSSLLAALAGELPVKNTQSSGNGVNVPIALNGIDLSRLNAAQQARARAVLPQTQSLAFNLSVMDIVSMGAYAYPELSPAQVELLIQRAVRYADIAEFVKRPYGDLSGGEQQRVQYARVIVQVLGGLGSSHDTQYLLLDEPTSSLDPRHQHALLRSIRRLCNAEQLGVLVILHDVNLAALYGDRIALLANGRLLTCDTPTLALTPRYLEQVYDMAVSVMPHPHHTNTPLVLFELSDDAPSDPHDRRPRDHPSPCADVLPQRQR